MQIRLRADNRGGLTGSPYYFSRQGEDMKSITRFLQGEQGQDLIEYTLLLAFVCVASAAMYINAGGSISGIWTVANTHLAAGNQAAS
jgi:Flp pilus assembly pilin Flp